MDDVYQSISNSLFSPAESSLNRLQETEAKLKEITDEQQVNVDAFVALVKENQSILDEMKVRT